MTHRVDPTLPHPLSTAEIIKHPRCPVATIPPVSRSPRNPWFIRTLREVTAATARNGLVVWGQYSPVAPVDSATIVSVLS